jgi:hypothetical protein
MTGMPKNLFNKIRQMIFQYSGKSYKVFTAILIQTGSSDPVVTVLENTLESSVVFQRLTDGTYIATFSNNLFQAPEEYVVITGAGLDENIMAVPIFFNVLEITSYSSGVLSDNVIGGNDSPCVLEIRKYN